MLLRSASTPVLSSFLSSACSLHHSDSPAPAGQHQQQHHHNHHSSASFPLHTTITCAFSPLSDSSDHHQSPAFRRTCSDSHLPSLLPDRPNPTLETIPSHSHGRSSDLDDEQSDDYDEPRPENRHHQHTAIPESRRRISFQGPQPPLFLARGLGIDRLGSGLFEGGKCPVATDHESDTETHYKKMVEEDPGNALLLRNYAQFLLQVKGDSQRAEEYYSRAILVDSGDGEALSQYAKLVWESHHDSERAATYFEQSVRAAPENSHVLAAYAGFLWDVDDDDDDAAGDGVVGDGSLESLKLATSATA